MNLPAWWLGTVCLSAEKAHAESFDQVLKGLESAAQLTFEGRPITHRYELPYEPFGVSVEIAGETFRAVVHTWPEFGVATLDLALLGHPQQVLEQFLHALNERLGWRTVELKVVNRGAARRTS